MATISTKSTADKLLMKRGKTVLFINAPAGYEKTIGKIASDIIRNTSARADIIQLFVKDQAELEQYLPKVSTQVNANGALWITYYKGTSANKTDINRDTINEYALTLGLEGVAICSIDDDWSAVRFKKV